MLSHHISRQHFQPSLLSSLHAWKDVPWSCVLVANITCRMARGLMYRCTGLCLRISLRVPVARQRCGMPYLCSFPNADAVVPVYLLLLLVGGVVCVVSTLVFTSATRCKAALQCVRRNLSRVQDGVDSGRQLQVSAEKAQTLCGGETGDRRQGVGGGSIDAFGMFSFAVVVAGSSSGLSQAR